VLPDPDLPRTGRFVVEVNALHNLQRRSDRPYEWLRDLRPVGYAGWSWRRYELTVESYAAAAARDPGRTAAAVAYAEVVRAAGDTARARAVLAEAAARDAGGVAERVARMALARGDWRTAAAWLDPAARAAARSGEWAELTEWCGLQARAAQAGGAEERARAEAALGIWCGERGKRREAVDLLTRAVAAGTADAETWRALAIAHAQSGAYAAARDVLLQTNLQRVYEAEFDLCSKLAAAGSAIAAGHTVPAEVAFELGRGRFEAEQYDAAAAAFTAALRADPRHRLAMAYLGEMQVRCKMRVVNQTLTPRAVTGAP
jgi:tetratricopeptide (TPR) repeat protein